MESELHLQTKTSIEEALWNATSLNQQKDQNIAELKGIIKELGEEKNQWERDKKKYEREKSSLSGHIQLLEEVNEKQSKTMFEQELEIKRLNNLLDSIRNSKASKCNEAVYNITKYSEHYFSSDQKFSIFLNETPIEIHVNVAIALSSVITELLLTDPLIRNYRININFEDPQSQNDIISLLVKGPVNEQAIFKTGAYTSLHKAVDFFVFAEKFGNTLFAGPIMHQLTNFPKNVHSMIRKIRLKAFLRNQSAILDIDLSFEEETQYLAERFTDIIKDEMFYSFSHDVQYIDILEKISLKMEKNEKNCDAYVRILIDLCKNNPQCSYCFKSAPIDKCSSDVTQEYATFLENNPNIDAEIVRASYILFMRQQAAKDKSPINPLIGWTQKMISKISQKT